MKFGGEYAAERVSSQGLGNKMNAVESSNLNDKDISMLGHESLSNFFKDECKQNT
jgi:hypothetical protein